MTADPSGWMPPIGHFKIDATKLPALSPGDEVELRISARVYKVETEKVDVSGYAQDGGKETMDAGTWVTADISKAVPA